MNKIKNIIIKFDLTKGSIAGIILYAGVLLFYLVYRGLGLVENEHGWITPVFVISYALMIVILLYRQKILERLGNSIKWLKYVILGFIALIGAYVVERSYNTTLFDMSSYYTFVNLGIIVIFFTLVYLAGQRTKAGAFFFLVCCFLIGIANYFVLMFKGQPIIPSDFFVLSTAASVSSGYVYIINDNVVAALIALGLGCLLVMFLPKPQLSRRRMTINTSVTLMIAVFCGFFYSNYDINETFDCYVDPWFTSGSYSSQGSILCFLKLSQDIKPQVPENYSPEYVDSILSGYETRQVGFGIEDEQQPHVVVIMNETFSDLTIYEDLFDDYEGPEYYNSISDAIVKDEAYVSVSGGGTANSEFEFLTGSSMGILGASVYPYNMYNLESSENLAAYFNALGYDTTAIHPMEGTNWRRNAVYSAFGFDQFYDITFYDEYEPETFRDHVSDRATYDTVLDQLKDSENPQFIFDVTMHNHSGYDTGLVPDEYQVNAAMDGVEDDEVNEFLSSIKKSDDDLEYLISELRELGEPVVLVFFGDHQPFFNDRLSESHFDKEMSDFEIEEVQTRYTVPYMIWSNYDIEYDFESLTTSSSEEIEEEDTLLQARFEMSSDSTLSQTAESTEKNEDLASEEGRGSDDLSLSLNYLGALAVDIAGLPSSPYQNYLLDIYSDMPVLNVNGYQDNNGNWHWLEEETATLERFYEYASVQYDSLFNSSDKAFTRFVQQIASQQVFR